jgi:hypothetical protein
MALQAASKRICSSGESVRPTSFRTSSIFTSSAIDAHNLARFSASRSKPISMLIVRFDAPVAWRIFLLSLCGQQ